jgi:hypothetical protein
MAMGDKYKVTTPADKHTGQVGKVHFADGMATVDADEHAAELAYFRQAGYLVEPVEAPAGAPEPQRPAGNASKDEWVAFAVARGMPEDQAKAANKADLIETLKEDQK